MEHLIIWPMVKKEIPLINREISWLYFNERVLQEAADQSVPLIERLRFLAIFSSNLDEFYRVRVATLNRLEEVNKKTKTLLGFNPRKLLYQIKDIVVRLEKRFDYLYEQVIVPSLEAKKIFIINEKQLNVERGHFVREYFRKELLSHLVPIMIHPEKKDFIFPELKDRHLYFFVKINFRKKQRYALLEVPNQVLSRFLILPGVKDMKFIILLDDIIRYCLEELFFLFDYDHIEAYSIQLTRDSELDIDVQVKEKFIDALAKSLAQREKGKPMRLLYDSAMPHDMLSLLVRYMGLSSDALIPSGRYQHFKDFIKFPNVGESELEYAPMPPLRLKDLDLKRSIITQMAQRDYLVHLPYQSFDYIVHLLREAAIDPKVKEIYICLYRLAENSSVINALINAAQNGKKVSCLIELKARFDEEANLYWRKKLEEGGVQVHIGLTEYKVHAKICLIVRIEKRKRMYYANLATGNFNEQTARLYADHSLFTTHRSICSDLYKLFKGLETNTIKKGYSSIITSPEESRLAIEQLIDQEIEIAQKGLDARIVLKMNSLTDEGLIRKLYEASNQGVQIDLIIRGMCCLVPGQKGFSDNINVRSIIDRYLEHARVWVFGNNGASKMFLSSADWMTRNIDHRIEVMFPIEDQHVREELWEILQFQLSDNTKARQINKQQDNRYLGKDQIHRIQAQKEIYTYLKNKLRT
jgi:polyphosphate kinase